MSKLIMMKGLPASGKTSRSTEIVRSGGKFIRVNRDLLRTMLHFDKFSGSNEGFTVYIEKGIAKSALSSGYNVVVDDCNLNPKNEEMWRGIAHETGAKFEVEEVETPVAQCIERDANRTDKVGRDVIMRMALESKLYPHPEKAFVLCDLDGTLCDIKHRLKYARGPEKDWDKFFAGVSGDTLRNSTRDVLHNYLSNGYEVILVSARPERCREDTVKWLWENGQVEGLSYKALFMRGNHDKRDDVLVKGDMYDKLFKDKYKIETVIDDRPKVIRMWMEKGLSVIDVGNQIDF